MEGAGCGLTVKFFSTGNNLVMKARYSSLPLAGRFMDLGRMLNVQLGARGAMMASTSPALKPSITAWVALLMFARTVDIVVYWFWDWMGIGKLGIG